MDLYIDPIETGVPMHATTVNWKRRRLVLFVHNSKLTSAKSKPVNKYLGEIDDLGEINI